MENFVKEHYQATLWKLESKYRAELQAKDSQIEYKRGQVEALKETINKMLKINSTTNDRFEPSDSITIDAEID